MKINVKRIFTFERFSLLIAFVSVIILFVMVTRREKLEEQKSEAILYVENTDEPSPFIVYGMVKKQTNDEEKQKKALTLANEKKKSELLEFLRTL